MKQVLDPSESISKNTLNDDGFELLKTNELLDQIQELSKMGYWVLDLVKQEITWSDETRRIHEVEENYVPNLEEGINFYDELSKPIITQVVGDAIAKQEKWDVKLGIITAKNNHKWVRATGKPYVEDNEVTKLFGVFQDITKEKRALDDLVKRENLISKLNKKLEATSTELEEFTYIATHDLKAPLASIKGHLEIIQNEIEKSNSVIDRSIHWIEDSISIAESKIQSIINIAHLKTSKTEKNQKTDLFKLVRKIKNNLTDDLSVNISRFTISTDELVIVETNKYYLETVLHNLIENAVKYRKQEKKVAIDIEIRKKGDKMELSVTDNGLGIDMAKDKVKLFKMFHRLHDHVEGSGIGLYLTSKMIENMGGTIEIDSELGRGSTFKIVL